MLKSKKVKIFIFSLFLLFLFFGNISISLAENKESIKIELQTKIPGSEQGNIITFDGTTRELGKYISSIYNYAISIVGIVATIMLMFGGFTWLTAGGSGDKVGQARDIIFGSLTGLILALSSYTILNMINPGLVNFNIIEITPANNELKEEEKITSEECREKCLPYSYKEFNPATGSCVCNEPGTHKACRVNRTYSGSEMMMCVVIDAAGTDQCDSDKSCNAEINCCGWSQGKWLAKCASSYRMTAKDCDELSSIFTGKGTLMTGHICEDKNCIPI